MEVFLLLLLLLLFSSSSESATNVVDLIRRSPGLGRHKFLTCVLFRHLLAWACTDFDK